MRPIKLTSRARRLVAVVAPGEGGLALVGVMAIVSAVIIVGVSIFVLGHSEGDIVEYEIDDTCAFYLAEAGLEHARGHIGALEMADPDASPVGRTFAGSLRGGTYVSEVVADTSGGSWLNAYVVVSTGWRDGAVRQVKATVVARTYAIYQWFIESGGGGYSWFRTGERFEGPVHVNGSVKIDGDPWFGGLVTCGGHVDIGPGDNPTFVEGYVEGVESISLPTRDYVLETLRAQALEAGGIYLPSLGNGTHYVVELGQPTVGQLHYQGYDSGGTEIPGSDGTVTISATTGAMWSEEDVWIDGVLDGQLTLGVNNNIHIRNDIIYADSTPGSGPNVDCDDMLGLISAGHPDGDIIIDYTIPNQTGVEIHAVMMSLQKTIQAEDYMHHPPRGDLTLYGGMLADYAIHIAQLDDQGNLISGYYRDYHYDYRVGLLPPPFFPFHGDFRVWVWEEVNPPVLS